MRAPQSLPAAYFFFSLALAPALLSVLGTLTSSPAARQRRSGGRLPAQQLGVGACASDDDGPLVSSAADRRADHGAPRRRETRSLAAAATATRPPSPVSCFGPERARTQADRTTSKRAAAARDTDRRSRSTTPTVDWRPAPRPSSPARAHSHAPAVRPTGRPPWAYRARSHPALASSIIGRAHIVTSSYQIPAPAAADRRRRWTFSRCKKEERLAPLHFLAPWYTPSNPRSGEREEHCSTLRTNR